jgi:hypothetical protein
VSVPLTPWTASAARAAGLLPDTPAVRTRRAMVRRASAARYAELFVLPRRTAGLAVTPGAHRGLAR